MRGKRVSGLVVAALVAGLFSPMSAALADPLPSMATLTPPSEPLDGMSAFTAQGFVDPTSGDAPATMALLVDGAQVDSEPCPAQVDGTCASMLSWDATAADGGHNLTVVLTTVLLATVTSDPTHVIVDNQDPTVTLSAPAGGEVTGPTTVTATGTVDTNQSDTAASMSFTYNGNAIGGGACAPAASHTCTESFSWDTTGLNTSAHHPLVVTFTTADGATAQDQASIREVNPPATATVLSPRSGTQAGIVTVSADGATDPNQTDTPISMQALVDGQPVGAAVACPTGGADPNDCPVTLSFDSTGLSGTHQLSVSLHTHHSPDVVSGAYSLAFTSPAPTVAITTPTEGATVSGIVAIHVDGNVDPSQSDTGGQLVLSVNGTTLDTVACPSTRTCSLDYSWDASGIVGARQLKATFRTAAGKDAAPDTTNVTVVSAPPAAVVASPADGATVSGVVAIVTTGSVSPTQTDAPASMQLLIDGTATAAAQPCTPTSQSPHGCSVAYSWDATGLSGPHTFQAKFVTHKGVTVLGALTTVTVVSPGPSAAITSPAASSTVHRTATVTATGVVDPSQTDSPATMVLLVDGAPYGDPVACVPTTADTRSCAVSLPWDTLGLLGQHTLATRLTTAKGVVGTSAALPVYVYGGTATQIAKVKTFTAGHKVTVTGKVLALLNRSAVAGIRVRVSIIPAVGKKKYVYVTTNAHGFFTYAYKPAINTTIESDVMGPAYVGTSHTFTKLTVRPVPSCGVGASVGRNVLDHGTCRITGLLKGTKVTLQYAFRGHWYTIGSGKAPGAKIPFSFKFAQRGAYLVRLVTASSRALVGTTGPSLKVAVT